MLSHELVRTLQRDRERLVAERMRHCQLEPRKERSTLARLRDAARGLVRPRGSRGRPVAARAIQKAC